MVTGVILAAGLGRRMGEAKQLLHFGGKPMVWHVANTACQAAFDEVIVITGAYADEVKQVLEELPLRIVYNEDWVQGQSTSVKKAVQSIVMAEGQVAVFLLGDQPLVDAELINELIKAHYETNASIIIPRWQNRPGNPVLFELGVWRSALLKLSGDEGARQIIRHNQEGIHYVEIQDNQMFLDIDTRLEYEMMEKIWPVLRMQEVVPGDCDVVKLSK